MHIRTCTAFSGYDSQAMALERLKRDYPQRFDYELVAWMEIDKYACQAHDAVFPESRGLNVGDITKVDPAQLPDFDLFTYSFPCQAISAAGKQKGLTEGSGTSSSLLWECRKIIEAKRPKYLLMENVKALTQKKFMPEFQRWQQVLTELGYKNFWQVMNAKDYGVPQNRERVFMVSILADDAEFVFPPKQELTKRLKDVLEENVDEKYYLSKERVAQLKLSTEKQQNRGNGFKFEPKGGEDLSNSITTKAGSRKTDNYIDEGL